MTSLKNFSPAQQRLLQQMIYLPLRKTANGWICQGDKPHSEATRYKLMDMGLFQRATDHPNAFELNDRGRAIAMEGWQ